MVISSNPRDSTSLTYSRFSDAMSMEKRIGTPYPALVAVAGAALALIPGTPTIVLEPDLALTLFVAPVLLDAAFDSSARDLRANWRTVAGLALGAGSP